MELGMGMKMRKRMEPGMGFGIRMVPGMGLGLSSPAQHWGNHCKVMLAEGQSPSQPMSGTSTAVQVSQGCYGPTPALRAILAQQTAFICPTSQPVCTGSLFYHRTTLNSAPFGSPLGEKSVINKGGVTLLYSFSKRWSRTRTKSS